MDFVHTALVLLVIFWTLQIAGSWYQWRNYRQAMTGATQRWRDGYLGVGQSRPRFGFGVVVLLEVAPDQTVRGLQLMKGITVFARFQPLPTYQGWTLARLGTHFAPGPNDTRFARAVRQAITQVEEVRRREQ